MRLRHRAVPVITLGPWSSCKSRLNNATRSIWIPSSHSQESFDLDHLLPDCIGEYRAGSTRPLCTDQEQTLFSFWPPEVGYDIINYNERGRNPGQGRLFPPTLISICEGGVGVGKYTIPAWNQAPGPGSRMGPEMSVPLITLHLSSQPWINFATRFSQETGSDWPPQD